MKGMSEEVKKSEGSLAKFGKGLGTLGGIMTKFVSTSLIGLGTLTGKLALSFEQSFAKVSTLLDSNVVDFGEYKKSLIQASSDSKVAVDDFSESVYSSISAGVDQKKAIEFTTGAMKLARGGFTTGAKAVDVMTTAINGYKLKTEDATRISDLLINTQNLGKTTVDELASSMGKVIPIASNSNFNINELSASYALLTKNGIATAESGTYLKSMLNELTKSGSATDLTLKKLTKKGFAQLKLEGKSTTEILGLLDKEAKANNMTLKDMFGSVEAGTAALMIATGGGAEYNEMLKSMEESAGATQQAVDKIDASPTEKMKDALNKLKNAGIQMGIALIPTFEKVAGKIGQLADKLSGLSSEQIDSIVNWGLVLIAIGPVLKGISGAIGLYTSLAGVATGATTALGIFGGATGLGGIATALVTGLIPFAPYLLAIAGLGGVIYLLRKKYKETTEQIDLFADKTEESYNQLNGGIDRNTIKISDSTKKAVGDYMKLDTDVTKALYNLKISHGIITDEMATELITKFDVMGQTIIDANNLKHQTEIDNLKLFFDENSTLTEQREIQILGIREANRAIEETRNKEHKTRIIEIIQKAKDENRELTQNELLEIGALQSQMKVKAVETLSETEQESNLIKERLKEHQGRLSKEMAVEILQSAFETRDKSIESAKLQYEGVVKNANTLLKAGEINKDEYNAMVKSAQGARDDSIQSAKDLTEGVKTEIRNGTPGIDKEVNLQTGTIKTAYSRVKDYISGFFSWLGEGNVHAKKKAENIKNLSSNNKATIAQNWTGTRNFKGGLTTLHEKGKGEEIYDLPSGTRIYNGERSEEMAQESAFQVAKRVLDGANMPRFEPAPIIKKEVPQQSQPFIVNITNFINETGQSIEELATELEFYRKQRNIGKGVTI